MPFNGSGVFSIVNTFVPGTTIFSSAVNANFTDIATGLSTAVLKNGTQTITADIPMNGWGFTGVGSIGSQAFQTIASAATTTILSANTLFIAISGVATITSFGTDVAANRNQIKFVRATGAFTMTHNGTSLILPGAADITCAAGDTFVVLSDASSNARVYAFQRASGYALISLPGYRNILRRNGGLEIWQRGAGGAASIAVAASVTTGQYTADGWYLTTNANQASVVSQQAGLTNQSQWCAKVQRNSGQTGTNTMLFAFPLDSDELYPALGQLIRLSFTAKAGANYSPTAGALALAVTVGTGAPAKSASFAGQSFVINTGVTLTVTATRYTIAAAAIVPTTTRQMELYFSPAWTGTAGADDSFYIDDVQIEILADAGDVASPFERINFEETLLLCQRYYFKTFLYGTAPAQNAGVSTGGIAWYSVATAGVGSSFQARFPVVMRATPSVTLYNPAATNGEVRNRSQASDCSSSAAAEVTTVSFRFTATTPASTVATSLLEVHFTADSGI